MPIEAVNSMLWQERAIWTPTPEATAQAEQVAPTPPVRRVEPGRESTARQDRREADRFHPSGRSAERATYSKAELEAPAVAESPAADRDRKIERLRARNREVIEHEQAHAAALGMYAGAIRYTYTQGPDGHLYATGGGTEVRMHINNRPEQAVIKSMTIRRGALANVHPSHADTSIAVGSLGIQQRAMTQLLARG